MPSALHARDAQSSRGVRSGGHASHRRHRSARCALAGYRRFCSLQPNGQSVPPQSKSQTYGKSKPNRKSVSPASPNLTTFPAILRAKMLHFHIQFPSIPWIPKTGGPKSCVSRCPHSKANFKHMGNQSQTEKVSLPMTKCLSFDKVSVI